MLYLYLYIGLLQLIIVCVTLFSLYTCSDRLCRHLAVQRLIYEVHMRQQPNCVLGFVGYYGRWLKH